jgi:hypothetical protein
MHRRALDAISAGTSRQPEDLAELAHHASAAGGSARIVAAQRDLGDLYLRSFAFRDSAEAYSTALRALGWPHALEASETACDLLIALATAEGFCGSAGHWEAAREACALARALGDPIRSARAALSIARPDTNGVARSRDVPSWRAGALALAADLLDDAEPLGIRVQAALLGEVAAPETARSDLAAQGRELARRAEQAGDPRVLAEVLGYAFYWHDELADREQRLALTERLRAAAATAADPALRCLATTLGVRALLVCGRVDEADRLIQESISIADETGRAHARGMARHLVANRLRMRGRFAQAGELVVEACRIQKEGGLTDADVIRSFAEFCVLFEHERLGTHVDAIQAFAATAPDLPVVRAVRAAALAASGQTNAARSLLDVLLASEFGREDLADTYLATATGAAIAALRTRHSAAAEKLAAEFLPRQDAFAFSAFSFTGLLGHHAGALLGMLGRHEEADVALEAAIARYRSADAPLWEARACLDRARVLREFGSPGSGRTATRLERRGATLARRVGVEAVPLWAEAPDRG